MTPTSKTGEIKNISAKEAVEPSNIINANKENSINVEMKMMFATEISSKIHDSAIYNKVISDPIYSQC